MSPQLPREPRDRPAPVVVPLRLDRVIAYLVLGERPILIDTGLPGQHETLLEQLALHNVSPEDLALLVVTHAHADHSGNLALLSAAKTPSIPIAAHALAAERLSQGRGAPFAESLRIGRLLRPLITRFPKVDAATVDLQTDAPRPLEPYGVHGTLYPTPGHTQGCLSLVLEGGCAIVGDLLRPGMFLRSGRRAHWVLNDPLTWQQSVRELLDLGVTRFYAGHGGPFSSAQVEELLRWLR